MDLAFLALPPRQSPEVAAMARPILRLSREVWMGKTASGGQEKEDFGKEVCRQVEEEVQQIIFPGRRPSWGGPWRARTRFWTTSGTS